MTGRWAVCCGILIVVSTSFPASTFAQNKIDDEARSVTAGCHEALKRTGQLQTFEVGMCLGILKGLHYLSGDICIPPATSLDRIGDVVSQYFDTHTDKLHDDFQETALDAMRSAWPCGRRNNILVAGEWLGTLGVLRAKDGVCDASGGVTSAPT